MIRSVHVLRALKDNFIFMLEHEAGFMCVDPGEAAPVRAFLRGRGELTHILCTHHHHDHVGGLGELIAGSPCPVVCSSFDRSRIPEATVTAEAAMRLGGEEARVLSLPGHTLGQIAYHFPRLEAVFVGDTLFSAGCGRLFEGSPEQMFASLQTLKRLPAETRVYFGHEYTLRNLDFVARFGLADAARLAEYRGTCERAVASGANTVPTRLATELEINPFLRAADVAEFARLRELRNSW